MKCESVAVYFSVFIGNPTCCESLYKKTNEVREMSEIVIIPTRSIYLV